MAEHVMRMMGRRLCLDAIPPTRLDREGYDLVDLNTQSAPKWKAWRKSLGDGTTESRLLCLLRAGCIGSPTRRFWRTRAPDVDDDPCKCPLCGADMCSVRHLWCDCNAITPFRCKLQTLHRIPASWWSTQPRITSKSGWITHPAADSPAARVNRQIAACSLGMLVVHICHHWSADHATDFSNFTLDGLPVLQSIFHGVRLCTVHV